MLTIGYAIYLFVLCIVLALLEIQIEGQNGWASALPCWRPQPDSHLFRWNKIATDGKTLTGYHLMMLCLITVILHLPFVSGNPWSFAKELETISMFGILPVEWGFLWVLWNPAYGLKRFNKDYIWWHKTSIGLIPLGYLIGIFLSFLVVLGADFISGRSLIGWFTTILVMAIGTIIAVFSQKLGRN
jgi:uncharacterized membrane protein